MGGIYKLKIMTLDGSWLRDAFQSMLWLDHNSSQDIGGIVGTKHLNELDLQQV